MCWSFPSSRILDSFLINENCHLLESNSELTQTDQARQTDNYIKMSGIADTPEAVIIPQPEAKNGGDISELLLTDFKQNRLRQFRQRIKSEPTRRCRKMNFWQNFYFLDKGQFSEVCRIINVNVPITRFLYFSGLLRF